MNYKTAIFPLAFIDFIVFFSIFKTVIIKLRADKLGYF